MSTMYPQQTALLTEPDPCCQARSHREGAHLSQEARSPFYPGGPWEAGPHLVRNGLCQWNANSIN